jgi:hypothetical protein
MLWEAIADFASGIDRSVGKQTHDHIASFFGTGEYIRMISSSGTIEEEATD